MNLKDLNLPQQQAVTCVDKPCLVLDYQHVKLGKGGAVLQTRFKNLLDGSIVPSAELSDAQDVTRGLGDPIKYGYHDALLRQMIEYRHHPADILGWFLDGTLLDALGWDDGARFRGYFPDAKSWLEDLEWIARQLHISYFKRIQAPPIIVMSKRAFGFDLRESQLPDYVPKIYEQRRSLVLAASIDVVTKER